MITKKILITGGTGFLGYHLAKKCISLGWRVTSLSTKKPLSHKKIKKVKYLICDINKKKKLKEIVNLNYDYVVNFAGYVDHSNKKKTIQSHYNGCKNLALIFLNRKIKKFIQIGSSVEYGNLKSPQFENNEKFNKKMNTYYSQAKLMSTKLLLNLFNKYQFPVNILRLYLTYGPKQDANRVIPVTIKKSLLNKKFNCSSGHQYRDFIYVDDVVSAIIKVLKNQKINGEIFNIGSGKPIKVKKIIEKIKNTIKSGQPIYGKIKLRKDEIPKLYPSILKAKKMLKWKPKININIGLKKTIKYYKLNNDQKN